MVKSLKLLNLGFGHFIQVDEVLMILNPSSNKIKKLINKCSEDQGLKDAETGKEKGIYDFTNGKKLGSIIYCNYGRIYLSYIQPETLINNLSFSK